MKYLNLIFISLLLSCTGDKPEQNDIEIARSKLFTLLPSSFTGIHFVNIINEDYTRNVFNYEYFYNGGGVAVLDVDNDGLKDLFFTGNMIEDQLYLNKGNLSFQDITSKAGVGGGNGWSTGVAIADINNDGFDDIYVSRSGGYTIPEMRQNLLFINNQNGTFTERASQYGLNDMGYSTQAAFFDYDRDGDLDIYLVNHPRNFNRPMEPKFRDSEDPKWLSDRLYQNNGNGHFTDVSKEAGIANNAFGLGLAIADLNNDGWPDIYVSNDYIETDYMYLNNGDGTFREVIQTATKHISNYGMGVDIADYNNDGLQDIMVLDMLAEDYKRSKTMMGAMDVQKFWKANKLGYHYQYMRNTLQLNNGNETFSEIGYLAGVANTDWSWAPLFADFDNDGYKDLLVTNGYKRDVSNRDFVKFTEEAARAKGGQVSFDIMETLNMIPSVKLKNYFFKNNGDLTFSNTTDDWGLAEYSFSNGAAYADLDNDGDLEIIINNINDEAFIYQNNASANNNYIKFNLPSNANHGTQVTITNGGQTQSLHANAVRGYLSSIDKTLHFGIGNSKIIDLVQIKWPDGSIQTLKQLEANQTINIKKSDVHNDPSSTGANQIFKDVSGQYGLNHTHKENEYNDFERELLLPHKQSQNGPFLTKGDINGDGLEDFFIGGASESSGQLFVQKENGSFIKSPGPWFKDKIQEDMGVLFFDADGDNDLDLYIVSGGNEFEEESDKYQDRLYVNDGTGKFTKNINALPIIRSSGSCVRAADFDEDGDSDLFIGGRVRPGNYPFPPKSYLFQNDNGIFSEVTDDIAPGLKNTGMVTDATWADIDSDGKLDLVVVGEWMPITIFKGNGRAFVNATDQFGLTQSNGWWNCIRVHDLDNDGDLDIVAGNLGLNSKFNASESQPFQVYCNDFDGNGKLDILLAQYYDDKCYPIRGKECTSEQMPFINQNFPTYDQFANASLSDILGSDRMKKSFHREARILSTSIVTNENGIFHIKPLSYQAQVAPVNGILIDDFDGDSNIDILLIGNSYAAEVETGRHDAGTGILLLGASTGNFTSIPLKETGFFANGDAKSIISVDLRNKKQIILIGNNSSAMQSFIKN